MNPETAAVHFLTKARGRVGILFDNDADGTCAGAILAALFRQRGLDSRLFTGELEIKTFADFAKQQLDFWIIVDFPVAENPEWLAPLKGKQVLIIDHHPAPNNLNAQGFLYVNPRLRDPDIYKCSTHVTFELGKEAGMKDFEWLSRLGQIGDREITGSDDEREAVDLIDAVISTKKENSVVKLANYLSQAKDMKQFLMEKRYQKLRETFLKELEKQIALYELSALGNITFFEVRSRFSMTSLLATRLFEIYPRRTIITYSRKKHEWGVSGRSPNWDLGTAFKKACENIGQGGGHERAAGAKVNDIKLFKARLERMLR